MMVFVQMTQSCVLGDKKKNRYFKTDKSSDNTQYLQNINILQYFIIYLYFVNYIIVYYFCNFRCKE